MYSKLTVLALAVLVLNLGVVRVIVSVLVVVAAIIDYIVCCSSSQKD